MSKIKVDPAFIEKSNKEFLDALVSGQYAEELKQGMEQIKKDEDKERREKIKRIK